MSKETLLQRLRQYEGAQWETTACYNGLRDEAAAEIDRLREELKHLRKQFLDAEDVEAERDRLREALKAIIEEDRHWTESGAEIARAALAKEAGQS